MYLEEGNIQILGLLVLKGATERGDPGSWLWLRYYNVDSRWRQSFLKHNKIKGFSLFL